MEQYDLYLCLKQILAEYLTEFKISYNDLNVKADNSIGCYIKGSVVSKYRELSSGEYYNHTNRVTFRTNGKFEQGSIEKCLTLNSNIRDTLIKIKNSTYVLDNNKSVLISKINLLSDILYIGKDEQGRPQYSLNLSIEYSVSG